MEVENQVKKKKKRRREREGEGEKEIPLFFWIFSSFSSSNLISSPLFLFSPLFFSPVRGHALIYIIEREEEDCYGFVTVNTGEGNEFHPLYRASYPKEKRRAAIRIGNIPKDHILEEGFWYLLFEMRYQPSSLHGPDLLYEVLLPFLSNGARLSKTDDDVEEEEEEGEEEKEEEVSESKYEESSTAESDASPERIVLTELMVEEDSVDTPG